MSIAARSALILALLFLLAPPAAADVGLPENGIDIVELADGRVVRCKAGNEKDGLIPLTFSTATLQVPKERIAHIRYFRDYDSTPRNAEEEKQVAKGLVRWAGKWIAKKKRDALYKAEVDKARKARAADEAHALWENRWILETKHYKIESNITKANLDYYIDLLEKFYKQFTKHFNVKLTAREKKQKLPVFIYRLREEYWKRYKDDTGGKGEHTLGYFVPSMGNERLVFFDQPGAREEVVGTLLHEATHFILHLAEPQVHLSRWLHEGCAEFFGASTYDAKGNFTPGHVQDGRLLTFQKMIADKKLIPIDNMLKAANPGQTLDFDHWYYAQAWTVVHYLLKTKKYAKRFQGYIKKLLGRRGVDYEPIKASARKFVLWENDKVLLQRSLKIKSYDKFMKEVSDYAMGLSMRGAAAYVERGEMRFWSDKDPKGAQEDFDTAMRQGGGDPKVLTELARAYAQIPGKAEESNRLLLKALDLDPLNVGTRYRYARRLKPKDSIRELRLCVAIEPDSGGPLGDLAWLLYLENVKEPYRAKTEKDIAICKEALAMGTRAIEIDPNHRHLDTCAALHLCLGEFEKARDTQKRAVQEEPENTHYLRRMATYYALLGEGDAFAKTLRRAELLMRREARGEKAMAMIRRFMNTVVMNSVSACYDWERAKEGAAALHGWYRRRPPTTESGWMTYALLMKRGGDAETARGVLQKALEAHPDSDRLKGLQRGLGG